MPRSEDEVVPRCQTRAHIRRRRLQTFSCEFDVDDQHVQGVGPEVVRPPPDHLVEQVGFDASFEHSRKMKGVAELAVFASSEFHVGKESLERSLDRDRLLSRRACLVERVGGKADQDLSGERVVPRVEREQLELQLVEFASRRESGERQACRVAGVIGSRSTSRRHGRDATGRGRRISGHKRATTSGELR